MEGGRRERVRMGGRERGGERGGKDGGREGREREEGGGDLRK